MSTDNIQLTIVHSDAGIIPVEIPFTATNLLGNTSILWNFETVPQKGLNNRVLSYPRGRLLGGSSSVSECHKYVIKNRFV